MKKFYSIYFVFIFFYIIFCIFSSSAEAASCASIKSVTPSTENLILGKPFTCEVIVDAEFSGSRTIACGLQINDEFPRNICPSDLYFDSWKNNKALFNCLMPASQESLLTGKNVKIVAYDFQDGCGPSTGISKSISFFPGTDIITPAPNIPSDDTSEIVKGLLALFLLQINHSTPNQAVTESSGIINTNPTFSIDIPLLPELNEPIVSAPSDLQSCISQKNIYMQASAVTGLPWELIAALHFREGNCKPNVSLVSGRTIKSVEPDVNGNCSSNYFGPGVPIVLNGGGCGFNSVLDSAIYAGRHLISKIGKNPSSLDELTKAVSRYNGGGNANCGKTPYTNCPPSFYGEDDTYVMSKYDQKHTPMYIVYCADHVLCSPPKVDDRPGVLTIYSLLQHQ